MLNSISGEQAYINAVMANLSEVKEKKEHIVQKGESLWSLAKKELNKKNASNKEISDYMLLIAKMNNLETVEKMNNIKASQKIYLPGKVEGNQKQAEFTAAEKTVVEAIDALKNDKTIRIKKAEVPSGNLYHVFNEKKYYNGFISKNHPLLSFSVDRAGDIKSVALDDSQKDRYMYGFDYNVDKNGTITIRRYPYEKYGQLTEAQNNELRSELTELLNASGLRNK